MKKYYKEFKITYTTKDNMKFTTKVFVCLDVENPFYLFFSPYDSIKGLFLYLETIPKYLYYNTKCEDKTMIPMTDIQLYNKVIDNDPYCSLSNFKFYVKVLAAKIGIHIKNADLCKIERTFTVLIEECSNDLINDKSKKYVHKVNKKKEIKVDK